VGRDRTADTRIFSPLLYRLSYRTFISLRRARPHLHFITAGEAALYFVMAGECHLRFISARKRTFQFTASDFSAAYLGQQK
jgi:hypothetical protein